MASGYDGSPGVGSPFFEDLRHDKELRNGDGDRTRQTHTSSISYLTLPDMSTETIFS